LCIGEYTVKGKQNESKQMVHFRLEDVSLRKKQMGKPCVPPQNAPYLLIATPDSDTLKLDKQKNGWKGVCVHQEVKGEAINCPI
jgi:hypothetical protein